jgi:hypothetical protein
MKKSPRSLLIALLVGTLFGTVFGSGFAPASAATAVSSPEGFNVITSPLPIKITTEPGKTIQSELRIKNEGNDPETIKVGLMKFGASGSDGTPDLYSLTPTDTFVNWVTFSPSQFVAQPNVWDSIQMTIKVPASASLGYYLAVTYSRVAQPGEKDATNFNGAAATLVLLNVQTPNEKRSLQLTDFTTQHKLYEYLPATFNVKVHNSGNVYLSPVGNVFISRGNKPVDTLDFNDAGGSVLPNSNRVFTLNWSNGFPVYKEKLVNGDPVNDSHGHPEETLHWDFTQLSRFRFGHYTAKLLVVYDNGTNDVPQESTLSFWVLPWKLMIFGFVLLVLIGFGVFVFVRSVLRKTRAGVSKVKNARKKQD